MCSGSGRGLCAGETAALRGTAYGSEWFSMKCGAGRGMPHGELMEFGGILAEVFGQEA